jgi:hypothetical protein
LFSEIEVLLQMLYGSAKTLEVHLSVQNPNEVYKLMKKQHGTPWKYELGNFHCRKRRLKD